MIMLDQEKLLIPRDLFEELQDANLANDDIRIKDIVDRILKSRMFQMLNEYPIPPEFCLHLRRIVYPSFDTKNPDIDYKSYQCINCKKYL
jgi:hypothetical protein